MPFVLWLSVVSFIVISTVQDSSVIAVQIFDQRKFKRRDQGFLGVVNVKVTDVLDLQLGGHGVSAKYCLIIIFLYAPP